MHISSLDGFGRLCGSLSNPWLLTYAISAGSVAVCSYECLKLRQTVLLRHKAGQEGRGEILLENSSLR